MRIGVDLEPFTAEWVPDYNSADKYWEYTGTVVVSFFGTEIYSTPVLDTQPHEYVLDNIVDQVMVEFGNLIGERLDKRIRKSEYDGLVIDRTDNVES